MGLAGLKPVSLFVELASFSHLIVIMIGIVNLILHIKRILCAVWTNLALHKPLFDTIMMVVVLTLQFAYRITLYEVH